MSRFTEDQVVEIINYYVDRKFSGKQLAEKYNVSTSKISAVVNRKTYGHIELPKNLQDKYDSSDFKDIAKYWKNLGGKKPKKTTKQYIKQAQKVHNNFYKYPPEISNYSGAKEDFTYICPKHGKVTQKAGQHLVSGCKKCACEKSAEKRNENYDFFEKVNIPELDFSKVKFFGYDKKVEGIICPEHGEFSKYPHELVKGIGCPKCSYEKLQKDETPISPIDPDTCDIDCNFLSAYQFAEFKEGQLNITEDVWRDKSEIVQSILGKKSKIYARKCEIRNLGNREYREFLTANHLQGHVGAKVKLGLFHEGELVSLMSFGGLRRNLGHQPKDNHWEILRLCNKLRATVVGGSQKLLKYFENNNQVKEIISYCDRNWFSGNIYEKMGFKFSHNTKPNFAYYKNGIKYNRFNFTKSKLVKQGHSEKKTADQIMTELGYYKISDLGNKLFTKKIK